MRTSAETNQSAATIDGERLGLEAFVAAAAGGVPVALSPGVLERLAGERQTVEKMAAGDKPVYGLNTGLGGNLKHRVSADEIGPYQRQIILGRCITVGEPLSATVARGALIARLQGVAQGGSGLSPHVATYLAAFLNAGLTPVIPGRGALGASDLGLNAAWAACLIGEGHSFYRGQMLASAEALKKAALKPVVLNARDAMGLINTSPVSTSHGAVTLAAVAESLLIAMAVWGMSVEGYAGNLSIIADPLVAARPAAQQAASGAVLRALTGGSAQNAPAAARSIQDALSFRTAAQVFGVALNALESAIREVETELNSASDSPLLLADEQEMLSTSNFHTPAIALAFDTLAISVTHLAAASFHRSVKLQTPHLSDLPKYLSPAGGASTGLNSIQKTLAALYAEIRLKATPASLDGFPVSETVEDHAPQTPLTIRKLEEQIALYRQMIAIEAMIAAQALDLRPVDPMGAGTGPAYTAVRETIPMLNEDRPTGPDAMGVMARLFDGRLAHSLAPLVQTACPSLGLGQAAHPKRDEASQ